MNQRTIELLLFLLVAFIFAYIGLALLAWLGSP